MHTAVRTPSTTDTPSTAGASSTERLVSSGIGALDARLGTLVRGRHYLLTGAPGAGKTTAVLHFLGQGLEEGKRCALLSQDDPGDLLNHADYIGYDLRPAIRSGRLVLVQFRMDFLRRYSRLMDPALVYEELAGMLSGEAGHPDRLVIDSAAPFLEGGHVSNDLIDGLGDFLAESGSTTYVTLPGELREGTQRRLYDRVVSSAAGVFHIERTRGKRREFSIAKLRQKAHQTEPFDFEIRPGAGIVDQLPSWEPDVLPLEVRRRVVVLDETNAVPPAFLNALANSFDVALFHSLESGFSDVAQGRYGSLVLGLDPFNPNVTLDLAYSLRKSGNGAPILFVAPRDGLRSSTRARALRAGGDDFILADASPVEVLERIDAASGRGHRRPGTPGLSPTPLQPVDGQGQPRPMTGPEIRDALGRVMAQPTPPLFAMILIEPRADFDRAWALLREQVRLEDGDLVAALDDRTLAVYLGHVDPGTAAELRDRLADAHDGPVELLRFPADQEGIRDRLGMTRPERPAAAL
jgi:KaiC/GvpD/RAD55 family RecA-like ATPase